MLIVRDGRKDTIKVEIGELPSQPENAPEVNEEGEDEDLGLTIEPLGDAAAHKPKSTRTTGLMVTEVAPQGLAAKAEIRPGDILVSVNGKDVTTISQFKDAIAKGDLAKGIRLVVESQGMERFAFLRQSVTSGEEDE